MSINLSYIINSIFKDRSTFSNLDDKEKEKWGFIVNRILSKKYPEYAQKLNIRSGDFSMVLNLWWVFIGSHRDSYYNSWVWKSMSGDKKDIIDKKTIDLVHKRYPILSIKDIEHLKEHHTEFFDEEVKYYEKLEEDYGK